MLGVRRAVEVGTLGLVVEPGIIWSSRPTSGVAAVPFLVPLHHELGTAFDAATSGGGTASRAVAGEGAVEDVGATVVAVRVETDVHRGQDATDWHGAPAVATLEGSQVRGHNSLLCLGGSRFVRARSEYRHGQEHHQTHTHQGLLVMREGPKERPAQTISQKFKMAICGGGENLTSLRSLETHGF